MPYHYPNRCCHLSRQCCCFVHIPYSYKNDIKNRRAALLSSNFLVQLTKLMRSRCIIFHLANKFMIYSDIEGWYVRPALSRLLEQHCIRCNTILQLISDFRLFAFFVDGKLQLILYVTGVPREHYNVKWKWALLTPNRLIRQWAHTLYRLNNAHILIWSCRAWIMKLCGKCKLLFVSIVYMHRFLACKLKLKV